MPRRVYDPSFGGHPVTLSWRWLTDISAIGGIVLFASALFFVLVMVFTTFGARTAPPELQFAEPLEPPGTKGAVFDHLGILTIAAVVLIAVAYGYPIWHHLMMPRFGSPGFSPF